MPRKGKQISVAQTVEPKLKSICIISDMELVQDSELVKAARDLGIEMAKRKIKVVHSGATLGLSAIVVQSSVTKGNDALGIHQQNFLESSSTKRPSFRIGREMTAQNPYERMVLMLQHSEAFIVLPGGLVTLEMFAATMLWANAKLHQKPVGFLNVNGFFDHLLAFLNQVNNKGFIPSGVYPLIVSAPTPDQLIDQLQNFVNNPNPVDNQVVRYIEPKRKKEEPDTDLRL